MAAEAVLLGNSQGWLGRSPEGREGMFYIFNYSTTGAVLAGFDPESDENVESESECRID